MKYLILIPLILVLSVLTNNTDVHADDFVTTEPQQNTYNYVSHYSIQINTTPDQVWPHLVNLKSWMHSFELAHHSGVKGQVGEVLQLYPNQDYYIQLTAMIENRLLTIVNLPSLDNNENSTGVGVITLNQGRSGSIVDLTLNRRYQWIGDGTDPMKEKRKSQEFQNATDSLWNNFLHKLKELAEKPK